MTEGETFPDLTSESAAFSGDNPAVSDWAAVDASPAAASDEPLSSADPQIWIAGGKSPPRLLHDIIRTVILRSHQLGVSEGTELSFPRILGKSPIRYAESVSWRSPYSILINKPQWEFAPNTIRAISDNGMVCTRFRALVVQLDADEVFHLDMKFHAREDETLRLKFGKSFALMVPDETVEVPQGAVDHAVFSLPGSSLVITITVYPAEFSTWDLMKFDPLEMKKRINRFYNLPEDAENEVNSSGNPVVYPTPNESIELLMRIIVKPLSAGPRAEPQTIAFQNEALNSKLDPELLLTAQFTADHSSCHYVPPDFRILGPIQDSVLPEVYLRNPRLHDLRDKTVRQVLELSFWDSRFDSPSADNSAADTTTTPASTNASARSFVSLQDGSEEFLRLLFTPMSRTAAMDTGTSEQLYREFVKLGAVPGLTAGQLLLCFQAQCQLDPRHKSVYFEALQMIAKNTGNIELVQETFRLESLGYVGETDLRQIYSEFVPGLHPERVRDVDVALAYCRLLRANPDRSGPLQRSLRALAVLRGSLFLSELPNADPLPLNEAYDALGADPSVDDDSICVAFEVMRGDYSGDEQQTGANLTVRRALITIAEARMSSRLLQYVEQADGVLPHWPVEPSDLLEFENQSDLGILLELPDRLRKFPEQIWWLRQVLKQLLVQRKSEMIDEYLKTGRINAHKLPADQWPVGLMNLGNTCYLNSLLQYFFAIKPLREFVTEFSDFDSSQIDFSGVLADRRIGGRKVTESETIRARQFVYYLQDLFLTLIKTPEREICPGKQLEYLALMPSGSEDFSFVEYAEVPVESMDESNTPMSITQNSGTESELDSESGLKRIADASSEKHNRESTSPDQSGIDQPDATQSAPLAGGSTSDSPGPVHSGSPSESEPSAFKRRVPHTYIEQSLSRTSSSKTVVSTAPTEVSTEETVTAESQVEQSPVKEAVSRKVKKPSFEVTEEQMLTASEMGRQQDVTECIGNILFQIEAATAPESLDSSGEQIDIIKRLFYGKTKQVMRRRHSTEQSRHNTEQFGYLIVNVAAKPEDLYQALDQYFAGEAAVQAGNEIFDRSVSIIELPPILQIQVQRIDYDKERGRLVKLETPLPFPITIYMDRYVEEEGENVESTRKRQEYFDAVREYLDLGEKKKELLSGPTDDPNASLRDSLKTASQWLSTNAATVGISVNPETIDVVDELIKDVDRQLAAVNERIKYLRDQLKQDFASEQKHSYTLFAVFIHRGEPSFGHYWVYLRDFSRTTLNGEPVFRKYNDQHVTEVPLSEVLNFAEGNTATPCFLTYVKVGMEHDLVNPLCRKVEPVDEQTDKENSAMTSAVPHGPVEKEVEIIAESAQRAPLKPVGTNTEKPKKEKFLDTDKRIEGIPVVELLHEDSSDSDSTDQEEEDDRDCTLDIDTAGIDLTKVGNVDNEQHW